LINSMKTKRAPRPKRNGPRNMRNNGIPTDVARFTRLGKQVYGFPPNLYTRLRYADSYTLTSSVGAVAKQTMLINSLFDPDSTGGGHQPLYRDTFAGLYNHYAVISARATVTFVSNTASVPMLCGAVFDDDTTTSTTYYVLIEQSKGVHAMIAGSTGSLSRETLHVEWSAKEFLGIDPFASEQYKTPVGSNPTELTSLLLWSAPADGSTTSSTTMLISIEFDVHWSELATQLGS
jgi:hypothetical protein